MSTASVLSSPQQLRYTKTPRFYADTERTEQTPLQNENKENYVTYTDNLSTPIPVSKDENDTNAIFFDKKGQVRRVGPYTYEKYLGQGGFGTTFLFTDPLLSRQVVVKELDAVASTYEYESLKRIEDVCGKTLSCPIALYRPIPATGKQYLVSTYIPGVDLSEILKNNLQKITPQMIIDCACQLLGVLEKIHVRKLYHRDIKPSNIMYDAQSSTFALIDFGIACTVPCTNNPTAGTPKYMLPEYANAGPFIISQHLEANDLYALGVTLYTLVNVYTRTMQTIMMKPFVIELCNRLLNQKVSGTTALDHLNWLRNEISYDKNKKRVKR